MSGGTNKPLTKGGSQPQLRTEQEKNEIRHQCKDEEIPGNLMRHGYELN